VNIKAFPRGFRQKNTKFNKLVIPYPKNQSIYSDLVNIGEERVPWYCPAADVYVAFGFSAVEHHEPGELGKDSDILRRIDISFQPFQPYSGCL